jgi:hypothetical protein
MYRTVGVILKAESRGDEDADWKQMWHGVRFLPSLHHRDVIYRKHRGVRSGYLTRLLQYAILGLTPGATCSE